MDTAIAIGDLSVDQIISSLLDIIRKHTGNSGENWNKNTALSAMGVDSLGFVELIFETEEKYKIDVNMNVNTLSFESATVEDVARLVQTAARSQRPPA